MEQAQRLTFQRFEVDQQFQQLVEQVRAGRSLVQISGLMAGAKALTIVALQRVTGRRFALIGSKGKDLEDLERDLRFFYSHFKNSSDLQNLVFTLPTSESDPYSGTSPHADVLEQRALALWRLTAGVG